MSATGGATGQGRGVAVAAWALNILGLGLGVWAPFEFDPVPTSLIACIVAPITAIGLAAALPDAFSLFGDERKGASLAVLFLAPPIGLIARAALTVQLVRLSADLLPALIGAAAGGAGAGLWWLRFRGNWRTWPLMALLGLLVACAVFEEVDQRLDRAAPQRFKVPVTDAFIARRRATTSYYVSLPAWGPNHEPDSVRVSSNVYESVQPGQDVCVVLHPGFLGAAWYTLDICPTPPG